MTWEIITDYSEIRSGQRLDGTAWDNVKGEQLQTFHGVVRETQPITEGPFRGGHTLRFEDDSLGNRVPSVIITTPDVCNVHAWKTPQAKTANVVEIWSQTTRNGQTRYYMFSTKAGRTLPVGTLQTLAMLTDGRARIVERPGFLPPRR